MSNEREANVWDSAEDIPEVAENMKLRPALMMVLKQHLETAGPSRTQAAKPLGVSQPRVFTYDARQDQSVRPRCIGEHGGRCWDARRIACEVLGLSKSLYVPLCP